MVIYKVYALIFKLWRPGRLRRFEQLIEPKPEDVLLDVGGFPATWTERPQKTNRIDCLNIHPVDWDGGQNPDHRISTSVGDGCDLQYDDNAYDILFSNSVIEHVGDWDRQVAFAAEVRRVGRKLWVQTPAYECPIEPHFLAPFVHWLPESVRRHALRWCTPWGWLVRPSQEVTDRIMRTTQLLSKRQVRELFPDCEIKTERLLWILPKSYVAYRLGPTLEDVATNDPHQAAAEAECGLAH